MMICISYQYDHNKSLPFIAIARFNTADSCGKSNNSVDCTDLKAGLSNFEEGTPKYVENKWASIFGSKIAIRTFGGSFES